MAITSLQKNNEAVFIEYARGLSKRHPEDVVVLLDRAIIDGSVYVTDEQFCDILSKCSLPSKSDIMSSYDAVFYLVSAAIGAEPFYGNNAVRKESLEYAKDIDAKTLKAWNNHKNLIVFDNFDKSFETKMREVVSKICSLVNITHTFKIPNKYILKNHNFKIPDDIICSERQVEKIFINRESQKKYPLSYSFIRKSICRGVASFIIKTVGYKNQQRIEQKETLTFRQYQHFKQFADTTRVVVKQNRTFFQLEKAHFEICKYEAPADVPVLLNVFSATDETVKMPSFLGEFEDVTNSSAFQSHSISRRDKSASYDMKEVSNNIRFLHVEDNGACKLDSV